MEYKITMRNIFRALCLELGEAEGKKAFEWYCSTYKVTIADEAPDTVAYEVLGLTKEEIAAGVAVQHVEGEKYRAKDIETGISVTFTAGDFNNTQVPEIPAPFAEDVIGGNMNAGEAARATAAAMYRIGAFLAVHRPELAGAEE